MRKTKLTFEFRGITFDIDIRSKVTLLQGNSATGKTTLINNVASDERFHNVYMWNQSIGMSVLQFANTIERDSILFLDEDSVALISKRGQMSALWHKPVFLVMACRNPLRTIRYSHNDCYILKTDNDGVTKLVKKYDRHDKLPKDKTYVCEDSTAGFTYFSNFLPNVISMHGNKQAAKYAKAGTLIMDGSAVGSLICRLERKKTSLFLPMSFEQLLVNYFSRDTPAYFQERFNSDFLTWERFFTAYCYRGDNPLGFVYRKNNLPKSVLCHKVLPELCNSKSLLVSEAFMQITDANTKTLSIPDKVRLVLTAIGYSRYYEDAIDTVPEKASIASILGSLLNAIKLNGEVLPNCFGSISTYGNKLLFVELIQKLITDNSYGISVDDALQYLPDTLDVETLPYLIRSIAKRQC